MIYAQAMYEAKLVFDRWDKDRHMIIYYGNARVVRPVPRKSPCTVCGKRSHLKNLCRPHYLASLPHAPCTVCGKRSYLKRLCKTHYTAWWMSHTTKGKACQRALGKRKYQKIKADPAKYAKLKARNAKNKHRCGRGSTA